MGPLIRGGASWLARRLPDGGVARLYRMGPLTSLLRGLLNLAVPHALSRIQIAGGYLSGRQMVLDLTCEKDMWLGSYERNLQSAIEDLLAPGMIAYDIGANIGYVTMMMAKAVGQSGKVFAFEPLPDNLERLRVNVELMADLAPVIVLPVAVADQPGQSQFQIHASASMGRLEGSPGRMNGYVDQVQVPVTSLDAFVYQSGNPAPDVVKIDIEGGEVGAVLGMTRLLEDVRPLLLLETHGFAAAAQIWEHLRQVEYSLRGLQPERPLLMKAEDLGKKGYLLARPVGIE
jgi:FkbM family methyltransferase